MRVIFMGTPEFAVPSLERLASAHDVAAVYARPDAVSGRGNVARPAAAKLTAMRLGLEIRQPETLRDPQILRELAELEADVVCVAAYGLILPDSVLEATPLGAINVHASLLPRWRGAAPIQRAILAGDERVGVSIMRMEEGLDTGPYCLQSSMLVAEMGAVALGKQLAELGAALLVEALPGIADGSAVWTAQDEDAVTYASKVRKEDVAPDPALDARHNMLRVRASAPTAPARILLGGKGVTLIAASAQELPGGPPQGMARLDADGLVLGTSSGYMLVGCIKPDGKTEMDAAAWARGARMGSDVVWERSR